MVAPHEEDRLRPGALVLDLLGDISRSDSRDLRLKALVELGEDLGVTAPTMRVTLARLRERGWFEVRRDGRESIYRMTDACVLALHEGGLRIHRPAPERWNGEWSMVIYTVPESDRPTRDELRTQLTWLGFAPLVPGTWIRPRPELDDVASATAGLTSARLTLMTTRTSGLPADRALAARCWDLDSLGRDYEVLVQELHARMPEYREAAVGGKSAIVARIRLVNQYRRFARRDPQFPPDLQPAGWQGEEARRLFEQAHAMLTADSDDHYGLTLVKDVPVSII